MTTQLGDNVWAAGIRGNFDDAQNAVKEVFADRAFANILEKRGYFLTSANSINWGRLVPQLVYYVYTCAHLAKSGQRLDFCVPTGNFGNILAAYYATCLGAPIGNLICASNENHVLTEFFKTGTYDRNRAFFKTISPSMDILISSNLERLLFELSERDGEYVAALMQQLAQTGSYTIRADILTKMKRMFLVGWCDDQATKATIMNTWRDYNYILDPHTAVAVSVLNKTVRKENPAVVVSTANHFKFAGDVLAAIGGAVQTDAIASVDALAQSTQSVVPRPLKEALELPERHKDIVEREKLKDWILGNIAV
jgi:threonine synthase